MLENFSNNPSVILSLNKWDVAEATQLASERNFLPYKKPFYGSSCFPMQDSCRTNDSIDLTEEKIAESSQKTYSNDWEMIPNNAQHPQAEYILIPITRFANVQGGCFRQ